MSANTAPIFPLTPVSTWGRLTDANTAMDGTGTVVTIFTAGTNGGRIDTVKVRALGTNGTTVLRFFINNGSSNSTAANNSLYYETTIAATTASNSSGLDDINWECALVLPAGYKLNCTIGTAVTAGLQVTALGGDY